MKAALEKTSDPWVIVDAVDGRSLTHEVLRRPPPQCLSLQLIIGAKWVWRCQASRFFSLADLGPEEPLGVGQPVEFGGLLLYFTFS